jgi:hypothetical protein
MTASSVRIGNSTTMGFYYADVVEMGAAFLAVAVVRVRVGEVAPRHEFKPRCKRTLLRGVLRQGSSLIGLDSNRDAHWQHRDYLRVRVVVLARLSQPSSKFLRCPTVGAPVQSNLVGMGCPPLFPVLTNANGITHAVRLHLYPSVLTARNSRDWERLPNSSRLQHEAATGSHATSQKGQAECSVASSGLGALQVARWQFAQRGHRFNNRSNNRQMYPDCDTSYRQMGAVSPRTRS